MVDLLDAPEHQAAEARPLPDLQHGAHPAQGSGRRGQPADLRHRRGGEEVDGHPGQPRRAQVRHHHGPDGRQGGLRRDPPVLHRRVGRRAHRSALRGLHGHPGPQGRPHGLPLQPRAVRHADRAARGHPRGEADEGQRAGVRARDHEGHHERGAGEAPSARPGARADRAARAARHGDRPHHYLRPRRRHRRPHARPGGQLRPDRREDLHPRRPQPRVGEARCLRVRPPVDPLRPADRVHHPGVSRRGVRRQGRLHRPRAHAAVAVGEGAGECAECPRQAQARDVRPRPRAVAGGRRRQGDGAGACGQVDLPDASGRGQGPGGGLRRVRDAAGADREPRLRAHRRGRGRRAAGRPRLGAAGHGQAGRRLRPGT